MQNLTQKRTLVSLAIQKERETRHASCSRVHCPKRRKEGLQRARGEVVGGSMGVLRGKIGMGGFTIWTSAAGDKKCEAYTPWFPFGVAAACLLIGITRLWSIVRSNRTQQMYPRTYTSLCGHTCIRQGCVISAFWGVIQLTLIFTPKPGPRCKINWEGHMYELHESIY